MRRRRGGETYISLDVALEGICQFWLKGGWESIQVLAFFLIIDTHELKMFTLLR